MSRREAREKALQILYSLEITEDSLSDDILNEKNFNVNLSQKDFIKQLIKGVLSNRELIDDFIKRYAREWKLERLTYIDRNIMRLAIYEMVYEHEIPFEVSIDEAVELAKKFSTSRAAGFINGILDAVRKELLKIRRE